MSKNTGTSELINYFDLGVNGDVGISGSLTLDTIANAVIDTDKFLVSDTGIIKYRTGAQLLSDIGAQGLLTNPVTGTGTTNYLPKFTGASTIGNSLFSDNGTNGGFGGTNYSSGTNVRTFNITAQEYPGLVFWANNTTTGSIFSYTYTGNLFLSADPTNVFVDSKISFFIDNSERLAIFNNGNVSIANTPIDYGFKLDVNGTARIQNAATFDTTIRVFNDIYAANGTSTAASIRFWDANTGLYHPGSDALGFIASGAEGMRIFSDGNVLIQSGGTFTNNGARFQVSGTATVSSSVAIGGTTITDSNMLNVIGNQSSVNIGLVLNNTNLTHSRIYAVQNVNGNFNIFDYTASSDRLSISSTGAATFSSSVTANGISSIGQEQAFTWQRTTGTASDIYSLNADSGSAYLYNNTTANILMLWSEGGNVGIGTDSPNNKLEVVGDIYAQTGSVILENRLTGGGGILSKMDIYASSNAGGTQPIRFFTANTERMQIKSNGFVGIGINPDYLLHIPQNNNLFLSNLFLLGTANNPRLSSGATGGSMSLEGGGAGEGKIYIQGAASGGNGFIQFFAGGSEASRITSSRNLLLGTDSDVGEKLRVNGRIGIIGATVASGNARSLFVRGSQNVADDQVLIMNITNTSLIFIAENNAGTGALFFCGYLSGNITKISDPSDIFATSDTDGKICIYKNSGVDSVNIKNRLGSTKNITVSYIGVSD